MQDCCPWYYRETRNWLLRKVGYISCVLKTLNDPLGYPVWNVFTDKISNLVTKSHIERIRKSWASIKHWNHCLMLSKIWYLLMLCHHGRLVKYCYSISDVWSKSLRHTGIFFQLILFLIFNIIITMKGEKEQSELSNNYTFHQSSFDHLSFWLYLTTWWLRLWPNRITQRTVCHATTKRIH